MTRIKTKRAYEPAEASDGFRVLVDRLWPRGIKKDELEADIWEKDIAPSASLRQWFHKDKVKNWGKFQTKYAHELATSEAAKAFAEKIRQHKTVTLLYAAKDEHNHTLVLRPFLEKQLED
jgi:uncharacterized protein YeaO (DUF488 family)